MLDPADNYLWDKWQFGDAPGTCSGSTTTTPATTTTQEVTTTTTGSASGFACVGTTCTLTIHPGLSFTGVDVNGVVQSGQLF